MRLSNLSPTLLKQMNTYWHNANQLALQQVYLYDNPQLKRALGTHDRPTAKALYILLANTLGKMKPL